MGTKKLLNDIKPATNRSNFPALKHAWEYSNPVVSSVWPDQVGGCDLDMSSVSLNDTGTGYRYLSGQNVGISSGTLSSFTSNLLMIMVGKNGNTTDWGFSLGDPINAVGVGLYPNNATTGYVTWTALHYLDLGNAAFSANSQQEACMALEAVLTDGSEACTTHTYDSGKTAVTSVAGALTDNNAGGALDLSSDQNVDIIANNSGAAGEVTAVYVFEFSDGLPDDVANAVGWMAENKGYIWPAWQGRS